MNPAPEPVVFSSIIEGAHRAFGDKLTPQVKEHVRRLGLDLDAKKAAYPVNEFLPGFIALADAMVPGGGTQAARLRQFGHEFMSGFARTAIGHAVFTMARTVGIRRAMERIGRNVRTTGNFMDATCEVKSSSEVLITTVVQPEFRAHVTPTWEVMALYRLGIFDGILSNLKAKEPFAEIVDHQPYTTIFRAKWSE